VFQYYCDRIYNQEDFMSTPAEIAVGITVEMFLAALAIGLLYRVWGRIFAVPQRQVVLSFQRGVLLRGGEVEKVLSPGTYWIMPKRTLMLCDMRSKPFQVPAQELLTVDGMGIRMSLGGEYHVVDTALFLTQNSDAFGAFFLEIRHAFHLAVGELNSEVILNGRDVLIPRVKELLIPRAAQLGIEMTQLDVWEAVPIGWSRQV
jgi:regulator of protease activity HflC (stomatin/prohibitin superfamily)